MILPRSAVLMLSIFCAIPALLHSADVPTAQARALQAIDRYEQAWQERDAGVRMTLLEQAVTTDVLYKDPSATVQGPAAVSALVTKFYQDLPQVKISRSSNIDLYGTAYRYAWKVVAPDGAVVMEGFDYGEVTPDGRISSVIGFWGALTPWPVKTAAGPSK